MTRNRWNYYHGDRTPVAKRQRQSSEGNIQGGTKPSVKAPDPMHITADEIRFVESLADSEIRVRLTQRGMSPRLVEHLIADRKTNGGRWRVVQELCR